MIVGVSVMGRGLGHDVIKVQFVEIITPTLNGGTFYAETQKICLMTLLKRLTKPQAIDNLDLTLKQDKIRFTASVFKCWVLSEIVRYQ